MRKYLKFTFLLFVAVFIFWFFGRNLDWTEVSRSLKQANALYLSLAVAVICLGYLLRAKRWQVLLAPITPTSLKELFATTTVGFAAVFFIGRMGEIVRPMWLPLRDKRVRPSAALVTLGVERIFDFASLITFFAINLLWFKPPSGKEEDLAFVKFVGGIMLAGVAFGFFMLLLYAKFSAKIIRWFERATEKKFIPQRLRRIFLSLMKQLAAALQILRDWREIVSVVFWTLTLWFSIAFPTWFVLLAFDMPLTFSDSLFIMGFAAVSSVVPTPGGAAGAFHTATAASLIFLGTDRDQAAAVSIAMHLVYFAPAIFFGFYYFLHGDISWMRFKEMLSSSEHPIEEVVEEVEHELDESIVENRESRESPLTLDSRLKTPD